MLGHVERFVARALADAQKVLGSLGVGPVDGQLTPMHPPQRLKVVPRRLAAEDPPERMLEPAIGISGCLQALLR